MATPPPQLPKHLQKNKRGGKFSPEALNKRFKKVCYIRFHHVTCIESPGLHGFAITCDGWGDKELGNPLYNRNDDKYKLFLEYVDPVSLVFKLHINGVEYKTADSTRGANAIIILPGLDAFDGDEPILLDKAYCKEFFDQTLLPAMKTYATFKENNEPVWDDKESYTTYATWSDIMNEDSIKRFLKLEVVGPNTDLKCPSVEFFFKASQDNVYACYHRGGITAEFRKAYHMTAADLDIGDWEDEWIIADVSFLSCLKRTTWNDTLTVLFVYSKCRTTPATMRNKPAPPMPTMRHPLKTWIE
jgi:hypothetical protein